MLDNFLIMLYKFKNNIEKDNKLRIEALAPAMLRNVNRHISFLKGKTSKFYQAQKSLTTQLKEFSPPSTNMRDQFSTIVQSISVAKTREWYEKSCSVMSEKPSWWKKLLTQLPLAGFDHTSFVINNQRTLWEQQGYYAAFSTPDLINVYWGSISTITYWLESIQKQMDYYGNQISNNQFKAYQTQANNLISALQEEKTIIRSSLLTRLSIAVERGDLCFDDLVVSTIQSLEKIKAISTIKLPKGMRRHITPDILGYIQQIIYINGAQTEKDQLNQLLYSQDNPNSSPLALRMNYLGITFAIPATVTNIVSETPPFYTKLPKFLQFLFRGEKAIYEFFQPKDCQFLLVAQNRLARHVVETDLTVSSLRYSASWDYYRQLTNLLASENERLRKKKASFSSVLYSNVHRLLNSYQTKLFKFSKHLFSKQLEVFDQLLCDLEKQIQTRTLLDKEKFIFENVHDQLLQFQGIWEIRPSKRWKKLLSRYEAIREMDARPRITDSIAEKAAQMMDEISAGKKLNSEDMALVAEVSTQISHGLPINTFAKVMCALNTRSTPDKLKMLLHSELAKSPLMLTPDELTEHLQTLKQHFETITSLQPRLIETSETQTALYRYFHIIFDTMEKIPDRNTFMPMKDNLQLIINTLLQLPINDVLRQSVMHLNKSIKTSEALDWSLFKQIAITPELRALSHILNPSITSADHEKTINKWVKENINDHDNTNNRTNCVLVEPPAISCSLTK